MNNYPDFKNFSYMNSYMDNFINSNDFINDNMYNNAFDFNKEELYTPYDGLIRGNLFKDLYVPYKSKEPYEIKPMNEQAKMLTKIDALKFAMIDLNLYLDINSNDKKYINLFNKYREQQDALVKEYESKYGPLSLNSESLNMTPWAWNNMPWPWDN